MTKKINGGEGSCSWITTFLNDAHRVHGCPCGSEEEERRLQEVEARKKLAVRSLLGSAYDDSDEDDSDDEGTS